MDIQFLGAASEVTGSCHLLNVAGRKVLLDCGLIQGSPADEARNSEPFAFKPEDIDAVILSHAHIDHSGRIPLLIKSGFTGSIYTHHASADLCRIMLKDAGFLNEKDAELENRKRARKGLNRIAPLYTLEEAVKSMEQFVGIEYDCVIELFPGIKFRLSDAGHILGSAIVECWLSENGINRKIVFSGDLGNRGVPILRDWKPVREADFVIMESTYGDRLHRSLESTNQEINEVICEALRSKGNILIPAFAVGRSQELLYLFAKNYDNWNLRNWQIFLDSPMAIETTGVYDKYVELFDEEAQALIRGRKLESLIGSVHFTKSTDESMRLNIIRSGALIIAGSGMCTGGRIRHHLKHNIWRRDCHVVIVGYQAEGTIGRQLVDGAEYIELWGETIRVAAKIHTIGGLSAHADQAGLISWYGQFSARLPIALVHGETAAIETLALKLEGMSQAPVYRVKSGDVIDLKKMQRKGNAKKHH